MKWFAAVLMLAMMLAISVAPAAVLGAPAQATSGSSRFT